MSFLHQDSSGTDEINTLLITDVRVTKLNDWKIIPILRRKERICFPLSFPTFTSLTVNVPSLISCIRLMQRISVDFPAPDNPMIATNSP